MHGRIALATGSSRGIGRAIATRLAQGGCFIVINYLNNRQAAEEVKEIIESRGSACGVKGFHVAQKQQVIQAVDEVSASDRASYITGQANRVDGSMYM